MALGSPVPRHTYPVGVIRLFVQMVMDAACSFRCGSAGLKLLPGIWPELARMPVANTGQWWLLRIGLFELTRPKEIADDWCWIIDHTIQIGTVKCLIIAGLRLSAYRQVKRPLGHRDLQILALEPVTKSDGVVVDRQLRETCERTGIVPRMLLSDEGTDLLSGYREFSQRYPDVLICRDIAHLAAKFLKQELEADPRWGRFVSAAGTAKQKLAQTPLAHLLPPTPKSKARYMNLHELVAWGNRALNYLEDPRPLAGQSPDVAKLHAKLGWLRDYQDALIEWKAAMSVIAVTCSSIRRRGYHASAGARLRKQLSTYRGHPLGDRLSQRLIDSVTEQSAQARRGERLVGSSECLESLIGKGKRLEGQQSQSGFTKTILGLAAAVVDPTHEYIQRALQQVRTMDVISWCRTHLGPSVQALRRSAFCTHGTKTG